MRIDAPSAATFDNRVDHGAALPGLGVFEKQPVLLADSRRPNGIFHAIVVDFDPTIADIFDERLPIVEGWKVHFPFLT